jgi:hypothetical protein
MPLGLLELGTEEVLTEGDSSQSLEGPMGRVPDPEQDRVALLRAVSGAPASVRLANKLRSDEGWRKTPLGALLPNLDSIDTPGGSFPSPLGARASNCLLRAKITTWSVDRSSPSPTEIYNGLVILSSWGLLHTGRAVPWRRLQPLRRGTSCLGRLPRHYEP